MTVATDPALEDWIDEARSVSVQEAAQRLGARLKKAGASEWIGPCPCCAGTDRFSINTAENVFNCRGSEGGDSISMVRHILGVEFMAACEWLVGSPAPGRDGAAIDHADIAHRKQESAARREAQEQERMRREARERASAIDSSQALFDAARPIFGTHAHAYLRARRLEPSLEQCRDLRFYPALKYVGFADDEADKLTDLGHFPAMIAAIRDVGGQIIGIHRTYLSPNAPKKLDCPGDARRNKAKKVFGKMQGGAIWLGPVRPAIALAEGIESAFAWHQLGMGGELTLVTAVSLGNLSGGCIGTLAHPKDKNRRIQSGKPDMNRPGIQLPADVHEVTLLGDGDSDPATTSAHLLTASRRFKAEGRLVTVSMAPPGMDWADYLMNDAEAAE